jgi:hypothetical protein
MAIVTKHFDESSWTNQEVGIAIGKGKPVASLIFDKDHLPGFLEAMQGVKVADNELEKPIAKVVRVVTRLLRSSGDMMRTKQPHAETNTCNSVTGPRISKMTLYLYWRNFGSETVEMKGLKFRPIGLSQDRIGLV